MTSHSGPRLAVCGHANLDHHIAVRELPKPGQSTPAIERSTLWGGTGANIARHAAGLGLGVRLWARVGDDFPSPWRKALEADGVDLRFLQTVPGTRTPACFVFTDLLERQAYVIDQGAMTGMAEEPPPLALIEGMAPGSWLHLATGDPLAYAALADAARKASIHVALDPGQEMRFRYNARSLKGMLQGADLLFVNEEELEVACGLLDCDSAEELLLHVPTLIVTRGPHGASLYRDGMPGVNQEALPAKIVDPTGAGDALRAGFHAGLADGLGMEAALRMGQAAAAVVVGQHGGQERAVRRVDLAPTS